MKNRLTNTDLLQGINEKNTYALDQFLISLQAKAIDIAGAIVKDDHTAKEIVHDTHLKFIERSIIFESLEKAQNYFYTSTRNGALNYLNNSDYKNHKNLSHEFPEIRDDTDPETAYARKEIHKEMLAIIEKDPEKYKQIFNLWLTGHATNEIATALGKEPKYISNRRNKLCKKIARILKL
jgi:RNA polymerase sigma-70 factor (ECF subfamily)